jgi:hypothetical protein
LAGAPAIAFDNTAGFRHSLAMVTPVLAKMLGRDILDQCSPKRNVHDLDSAANAECRNTALQSRVEEIDFELIERQKIGALS